MADTTNDRIAQAREALAAVPAPPWRWIGTRHSGGPELVTDHSGRQYLLRAAKPLDDRGEELLDSESDAVICGDLQFRDQRPGEKYATMRRGDQLAIGRTSYDPDSIVGVDNPIARWMENSPQYVADLIAEVDRLQKLVDTSSVEVGSSNGQWEYWRRRYEELANIRWDDELPPGGEVCATCELPVESEPCPDHSPEGIIARLTAERDQARGIAVRLENENARLLAERSEVLREAKRHVVAWLVKKAGEYRATGNRQREADAVGTMASKIERGAVRLFLDADGGVRV